MRSPLLSGGAARRSKARPLWITLLVLPFALLGCAAVVFASATDTSRQAGDPIRATLRPALAAPRPHEPEPSAAVGHVLAYTPFVRSGLPRHRLIALTFDDGPSPYTEPLVSELVKLHAPATFFVVGQQLDYFSAGLRDEIRHGFAIGDHTENHPPLSLMSPRTQYSQIEKDALRIHHLGGGWPDLFRPPYGFFNHQTLSVLRRLHMLMVMWSVDPQDWLRPPAKAIVARVLQAARPGAIVELHDGGGDRSHTLAALPGIVAGLRRRGYELVTVPQLLASDPPPLHQQLTRQTE